MELWLTFEAWVDLLVVDLVGMVGFSAVQRLVARTPIRRSGSRCDSTTAVVEAMKYACLVYVKNTKCLQRSAVVTRLLRRRGVPANLVIGCRLPPLEAHAWVEVSGDVVSDDRDGLQFYRVLDRW